MEPIDLDLSSDDDGSDEYLNSVARLKALKKQTKVDQMVEENNVKEAVKDPLQQIVQEIHDCTTSTWLRQNTQSSQNTRSQRRRGRPRRQIQAVDEDDLDLEIVSVEDWAPSSVPVPQANTLDDSFLFDNDLAIVDPPSAEGDDDNYEIGVKVLWRSKRVHRLSIQKNETFRKVFQHFADLEGVAANKILLMRKEKIISQTDTPKSIKLSVIDILEGGIVQKSDKETEDEPDENSCVIKVQTTSKKSLSLRIRKDEDFRPVFEKCAQELEVDESKIRLYFDGEAVDRSDTPDSLDIEDEACLDLRVSS